MKNLLPNNSSKIVFAVLLCFVLVGLYFLLLTDETDTAYYCFGVGIVPMALLFVMNATDRTGR